MTKQNKLFKTAKGGKTFIQYYAVCKHYTLDDLKI